MPRKPEPSSEEDVNPFDGRDTEDLETRVNDISEEAQTIAEQDKISDADLERLEELGDERESIEAELRDRADQDAARAEQAAGALARALGQTLSEGEGGDGEGEGEIVVDDTIPEGENVPELVPATTEEPVETAVEVMPAATTSSKTAATATLATRRPKALAPRRTPVENGAGLIAGPGSSNSFRAGTSIDVHQLARAISDRYVRTNRPTGRREEFIMATAPKNLSRRVTASDIESTFATFEDIKREHMRLMASALTPGSREALVASGSWCTPLTPDYTFFRLAEALRPVENSLPSVSAPRGGIRFIEGDCTTGVSAGVGDVRPRLLVQHVAGDVQTVRDGDLSAGRRRVRVGDLGVHPVRQPRLPGVPRARRELAGRPRRRPRRRRRKRSTSTTSTRSRRPCRRTAASTTCRGTSSRIGRSPRSRTGSGTASRRPPRSW